MTLPSSPHRLSSPRRHRRVRGLLLLLALGSALSGCSGTRFGEALSRSFSNPTPSAAPATATPTGGTEGMASRQATGAALTPATRQPPPAGLPSNAKASGVAGTPQVGGTDAPSKAATAAGGAPKASPAPGSAPGTTASTAAASTSAANTVAPARPAPYRVTILLPEADAAAPAEVVTRALRAAGVPFEVETIERIGRTSAPQTPVSRQAPPPR